MMPPPSSPPPPRERLVVPDFRLGDLPLTLSLWLVPSGAHVLAGDRVAELVAGGVTIDLESPVTGRLVATLADEDAPLTAGATIAEFEVES